MNVRTCVHWGSIEKARPCSTHIPNTSYEYISVLVYTYSKLSIAGMSLELKSSPNDNSISLFRDVAKFSEYHKSSNTNRG